LSSRCDICGNSRSGLESGRRSAFSQLEFRVESRSVVSPLSGPFVSTRSERSRMNADQGG
jgi:hypothetical protein